MSLRNTWLGGQSDNSVGIKELDGEYFLLGVKKGMKGLIDSSRTANNCPWTGQSHLHI